jgi:hypothetical protein
MAATVTAVTAVTVGVGPPLSARCSRCSEVPVRPEESRVSPE